jgi:hypothetical protein
MESEELTSYVLKLNTYPFLNLLRIMAILLALGGLVVIVLAIGPEVRGFKP